jgi:hypothetical protein
MSAPRPYLPVWEVDTFWKPARNPSRLCCKNVTWFSIARALAVVSTACRHCAGPGRPEIAAAPCIARHECCRGRSVTRSRGRLQYRPHGSSANARGPMRLPKGRARWTQRLFHELAVTWPRMGGAVAPPLREWRKRRKWRKVPFRQMRLQLCTKFWGTFQL